MIFVVMGKKKMKLIDADELKKALGITSEDCNKCGWGSYESCGRGYDFEDACVAIDNAVPVDTIPVERIEELEQLDYELYCHTGKSHLNEQQWEWLKGALKNETD